MVIFKRITYLQFGYNMIELAKNAIMYIIFAISKLKILQPIGQNLLHILMPNFFFFLF